MKSPSKSGRRGSRFPDVWGSVFTRRRHAQSGGAPRARFDLRDEPWIAVRLRDGTQTEFSIRDAFHRAADIRELIGELPTQSFAILRLLLAILYRSSRIPVDLSQWRHWHDSGLPLDLIEDYLDEFADRFDLFHPERPFFQVADLQTAKGESKDVTPLIFDLPTRNRLFSNRAGEGAIDLSYAEAARWIVNAQAFDPSGIKSGALGDSRVKGGKGYPIGVAWSGLLGGVYAQGQTLRETLLLNLVAPGKYLDAAALTDLPPWEEATPDTAAERELLVPDGPVRLYTWQSRRIRLFEDDSRVIGCLVTNGDKLTPQNMQRREPMSSWRFSEPQTKQAKQTTYMPRKHLPGRALWRGIAALLPGIAPAVPKYDVSSSEAPGIVHWLGQLRTEGHLEAGAHVQLRSVGVEYGSNDSVVDDILQDAVSLSVALLAKENRELALAAEAAVRVADDGVFALRRLAENLELAAGGGSDGPRDRASEAGYAALDGPYRRWLRGLVTGVDPLDALTEWHRTAHATLRRLGDDLVRGAGVVAWTGREVSRVGRRELMNTPRAEALFRRSLAKTFGSLARKDDAA